jgi:integrase
MMGDMGRPKGRFQDLPPHMTGRESGRKVHYYYQAAGRKKPLGTDKAEALRQWAILEAGSIGSSFMPVSDAYEKHVNATFEADSSKRHYTTALKQLRKSFGKARLEQIEPHHVKKYIRRRSKKGAAMFEKRILSALFNWAREEGLTTAPNPCHGIKFSKAEMKVIGKLGKRDRYVQAAEFDAVLLKADPILQDAMELAYLTGQRPGDLLKMTRQDMREGTLLIVQDKTGAKVPIRIEGKLKRVLERALARPRRIRSMYIIADEHGQRITYNALNKRFVKARKDAGVDYWQFRDIRAKTATDLPDLKSAQGLLGHAKETTTTIYRRSKGTPIAPLNPDLEPF